MRRTNLNVLLDMAVDDAKLTGRPLMEVVQQIVKDNDIELLPFQKAALQAVAAQPPALNRAPKGNEGSSPSQGT